MTEMFDCAGKKIHEGELVKIINRPDIIANSADYWTIFDYIEMENSIAFVLKNAVTNEVMVVPQSNIQHTY